jgi:hypothetical protein
VCVCVRACFSTYVYESNNNVYLRIGVELAKAAS